MNRPPFQTRTIRLVGEEQRATAQAMIAHAPLGIEIVAREVAKPRKPDQNALMWSGPIRDIADQAWVRGNRFSAEAWHEHCKREFLPEEDDEELEKKARSPETWKKWDYLPDGERVLVGSTTRLTVYGFSCYLEQVYALGADLGVQFTARRES